MYRYDHIDHEIVQARVAQFRGQVESTGEVTSAAARASSAMLVSVVDRDVGGVLDALRDLLARGRVARRRSARRPDGYRKENACSDGSGYRVLGEPRIS